MKNFIYGLSLCAAFCLMGCASENVPESSSILLDYRVDFENVGFKKIKTDIVLCKGQQRASWMFCELLPSHKRTFFGPFNMIPDPESTLWWMDMESKKASSVKINIQLPKLFYNAEYPSTIIFYINSSTDQVQVAYRVFSFQKKEYTLVDSEGKPFELGKDNLRKQ